MQVLTICNKVRLQSISRKAPVMPVTTVAHAQAMNTVDHPGHQVPTLMPTGTTTGQCAIQMAGMVRLDRSRGGSQRIEERHLHGSSGSMTIEAATQSHIETVTILYAEGVGDGERLCVYISAMPFAKVCDDRPARYDRNFG